MSSCGIPSFEEGVKKTPPEGVTDKAPEGVQIVHPKRIRRESF